MDKLCRLCGQLKDFEKDFHKKKGTVDGYRNECKECVKDIQKKYKEAPGFKEKQKEYDKKRYQENREAILEHKKEYHIENREEILKKKAIYREKHPEKIKEWFDNHKEEKKEYMKEYKIKHPEKGAEIQARYRERYPHIIAWRSLLYSTLKRLGTPKSSHTIEMLGYSADDLKEHLTSLFTPGMSWENHGEWHIDHVRPVSSFDPSTPVNEVCALSNLQPLWGTTREIDGIIYEGNLNKNAK